MQDIERELVDLTGLDWAERSVTSGTSGTFPKARDGRGEDARYYKTSCYDSYRGIYGHECVNELVAARLMKLLGIEHLDYRLLHARICIDSAEHVTWLNESRSFRKGGERKIALDTYYDLHRRDGESPIEFCDRHGWGERIRQMMLADYLIANRDRHGANIEVVLDRAGVPRLAPLFDHGLSFVFSCYQDSARVRGFDPLEDVNANNYLGTRSLEENLRFVGRVDVRPLRVEHRELLFAGLDGVLQECYYDKMWEMVWKRWCRYEDLCDSRRAGA